MKLFIRLFVAFSVLWGNVVIGQSNSAIAKLSLNEKTFQFEQFSFELPSLRFNFKEVKGTRYIEVSFANAISDGKIGFPALPSLKQLIEIPLKADPEIIIHSYEEVLISLDELGLKYPVIPMQPSLRKDQDPNNVPFYKNSEAYSTKGFIERPLVEVEISGIARNRQIGRLTISPVQYDPSTHTIKLFKNIVFSIHYKNASFSETQQLAQKYYSPVFDNLLSKTLINIDRNSTKDQLTQYPISYLIISHRMFENTLQPFINWKTKEGYKVTVAYTDVIGTTTTAIKNYISSVYNNATPGNPAPSYLLLVGDIDQIPSFNGTTGSHPTDTYYGTMNGSSDVIPDLYIGRMSATTTQQLQDILDKTLEYEQYLMPDPSYLQYALMIAGVDASNAPTYGNGQINYGTQYYFNSSNGITSYTYLYGSGSPIVSNSPQAAPAIKQNISNGIGFGNYTAHCSSTGWSDPSVSTSDIPTFTNAHKYGLLIGNCCQSNKFDEWECFGEAILRAANKGAIGYIGASDYSYWNEDYYYSVGVKSITATPTYDANHLGFYDKLFHQNNEPENQWFVTAAQINYGGNLAVEESGSSTVYYWEMYHLMGDPSLLPYMGIPTALFANYQNSVPLGVSTITIETEPYAYVGLSLNNTWIDAKYTGTSNSVILDLSSIQNPCVLDIVITKQNKIPHVGTIQIVPNNTPYVIQETYTMHDAGVLSNNSAEYSETIVLDVTLKNVGLQDAYQVQATLSSQHPNITITNNTASFGDILASTSSTIYQAFTFEIDTLITDQSLATFTITANDNQNQTWSSNFSIVLNAPVLQATTVLVDDINGNNNGRLDPGEDVTIKILTNNIGHALSPNAIGTLSTASNFVSISNNSYTLGQIAVNSPVYAQFPIHVDANTPIGTPVSFTYTVDANGYTTTKTIGLTVGLIVEDFETGNFAHFPWDTTSFGDAPWIILNNGNIFEGNYSARSGVIGNGTWGNNTKSDLKMTINVLSPDTLSFYKRVSSEANYDFLQFFVDNNKLGEWSGEIPWSREAYYLTAGTHTLLWRYTKDYSVSSGEDAGYIDFILFPPIDLPLSSLPVTSDFTQLSVFPNPTSNLSTLWISSAENTNIRIELYNQIGKLLSTQQANIYQGNNYITLSLANFSEGIYYLKVTSSKTSETMKIIKIK